MKNRLNKLGADIERLGRLLKQSGDPAMVITPLVEIIYQLRRLESQKETVRDDFMDILDSIIEHSISKPEFSVDTIAKEMLVSRSLLYKRFAEHQSCGLGEYLAEKRILAAKALLCNPAVSIFEVADAVGFINQRYFSTYFKKHTGMTPTQWRLYIDSQNGSQKT